LVRRKRESPCYTYSTHFRTLVRAALLARQPDAAADFIEEWERLEYEYPTSKRFAIAAARSNLALLLGRTDEAARLSGTVAEEALHADDVTYALDASTSFVRACIAAGTPHRARRNLARVLGLRHCSIGEMRFDARLLVGEYHAAVLECDGNEPRFDHAEHARRAYAAAKREGERLDELLCTEHRAAAVAQSVARLAALGGEGGPRQPRGASI
jgi:hypothetical protein